MKHLTAVLAVVLLLGAAGCAELFGTKYDGTWLFMLGLDPGVSGACAGDDDDDWTITGSDGQLVDIYTTANPFVIVFFQLLITRLFGKLKPATFLIGARAFLPLLDHAAEDHQHVRFGHTGFIRIRSALCNLTVLDRGVDQPKGR